MLVDSIFAEFKLKPKDFDLYWIVEFDTNSNVPIFMNSAPGFDPGIKIYELAKT